MIYKEGKKSTLEQSIYRGTRPDLVKPHLNVVNHLVIIGIDQCLFFMAIKEKRRLFKNKSIRLEARIHLLEHTWLVH